MLLNFNSLSTRDFLQLVQSEGFRVHFSQFGEDAFIINFFQRMKNGFYVDIGAYHPTKFSNTFLLYQLLNWNGIAVDADERAVERMRAARARDICVCAALSDTEETLHFTRFEEGAVNTLSATIAEHQQKTFGVHDKREVRTQKLADVLAKSIPPGQKIDYMNIDCEGFDEKVVRGNDWTRFRPRLVSVELHAFSFADPMRNETVRFLHSIDYQLVSYHTVTAFFKDTTV